MALSAAVHHSFDKVDWPTGTEDGQGRGNTPRRPTTRAARGPELFQLFEEEPGGKRPAPLPEVAGPQERVQRRTVEQLADLAPMVQILDALVPLMVGAARGSLQVLGHHGA